MQAELSNTPCLSPGWGVIHVTGCEGNATSFIIQRASDTRYLSPAGWQESQCALLPESQESGADSLSFTVGPAVIDQINSLENYRILLPETGQKCALRITAIVHSGMGNTQGLTATDLAAASARTAQPLPRASATADPGARARQTEPAPGSTPAAGEENSPGETATAAGEDNRTLSMEAISLSAEAAASAKSAAPGATESDETLSMPEPRAKSRSWPWILAILLLLGGIAGGGLWLLTSMHQTPPPPPLAGDTAEPAPDALPEASASPDAGTPPPPPPGTPASPASKGQPSPTSSSLATARSHLRSHADDVKQTMELAKNLLRDDAKTNADPAFLLLEDAAQRGNPEAMRLVGNYYNPEQQEPRGSIIPDAAQAKDWYKKAAKAGDQEAATALSAMKSSLELKAKAGDLTAKRLLERW